MSIAIRREIVTVCRRLYERGLIAGQDGNVSVRLPGGRVLVTPAGMSKVDVGASDLVEMRLGEVASSHGSRAGRSGPRASSEVLMHLRIYERRPDVNAVVHAHPPTATAFAVAGEGFMDCILPEVIFQVGQVPLLEYATPGSTGLADSFEPYVATHDAFLLANHGATTVGATLLLAHQRMESLEHAARIIFAARQLGRVNALSGEQVADLMAARQRAGLGGPYPGCSTTDSRREKR
ncbi:MAG TPA: class II aldolase/adducin family protein [Gemmatimonadaceae bacterium]|nr:class II aldolase/adducin family protein [Gemmatimonadaceae bacterium]